MITFDQDLKKYPTDENGNQYYRKTQEGDDMPIYSTDFLQLYAKLKNGKYFYPKDRYGNEFYIPQPFGEEISPVYNDSRHQYAKDKSGNEFYPIAPTGNEAIMRTLNGEKFYAKNAHGREIYPKGKNGKEYVRTDKYAKNAFGQEYYPKLKFGDEYIAKDNYYILDEKGDVIYPKTKDKQPIYPTDPKTGDELYFLLNNKYHFGKDSLGNQKYARKKKGFEYYPPNQQIAVRRDGIPIYAYNFLSKKVIFPKLNGAEYYLKHPTTGADLDVVTHYARDAEGNEFYPRKFKSEILLHNKYAVEKNNIAYYPLDSYNNEFVLSWDVTLTERDVLPIGYPITNDGYVILPEVNDHYYISETLQPFVTRKQIIGQLFRKLVGYKDYLTTVKSSRTSRASSVYYLYKTKDGKIITNKNLVNKNFSFNKSWYFKILLSAFLMFIICFTFYFGTIKADELEESFNVP